MRAEDRRVLTEGLWIKCEGCREPVWKKDLEANVNICPKCGFHYKITAYERLDLLLDEGWKEFDSTLHSTDPLKFRAAKPTRTASSTLPARVGVRDAVINAEGTLDGIPRHCFRDGIQLHWRIDGLRRRRKDHTCHRTRARKKIGR